MDSVYEKCPVLSNDQWQIRLIEQQDAKDLLEVYSDKMALPFFNSDNCGGDNFYCQIEDHMREAIKYWLLEYKGKGFVRFAIVEQKTQKAIGTIELFNRQAEDYFNDCGLLRLDVGSHYEEEEVLKGILSVIVEPAFTLFDCQMIATKAPVYAVERIKALKQLGFEKSEELLIGHDGKRTYGDYWIIKKSK